MRERTIIAAILKRINPKQVIGKHAIQPLMNEQKMIDMCLLKDNVYLRVKVIVLSGL